MPYRRFLVAATVLALASIAARPAYAIGYAREFPAGSLVIPMDLAYQDSGMFQAYGLVYQLLRQGVTVYWVIDDAKVWHHAPCNTPGDECAWDCAEEGSGVKCAYPTASPDFYVGAMVLWDSEGTMAPGTAIARHGYRGGPFVVDAAEAERATPIIDAWNDQSTWTDNPWAQRTVFHVVSVHETTEAFSGNVRKEMVQPPTIAVFADGNEDIATRYLRAAGIPQSNGAEFPAAKCGADNCGAGTANPDMLTVPSIMGDMGTCDAPNMDHGNGALFNPDGTPAYCQIMSMHWNVTDRETVQCNGGGCPATQAECAGETFTYHGHEVVAEVRRFLSFPTHFFAECQAVNAYENTVPNPAWPFLDDEGRMGHFLTTEGMPPDCPCDAGGGDYECVTGGCDDGARDCCLPSDVKEFGAGFMIAAQPNSNSIRVLSSDVPYNQLDGAFATIGGSEPAYNLSSFLMTAYKNDLDVTFITGPMGPGVQDVWMTGFIDGSCDITTYDEFAETMDCNLGKVSYLGGHSYSTNVPLSRNASSQGARLFLNALFEADCVTGALSPVVGLSWSGRTLIPDPVPVAEPYTLTYANTGDAPATDATLTVTLTPGLTVTATDPPAMIDGTTITWPIGTIAAGSSGMRSITIQFPAQAAYDLTAVLTYGPGRSVTATHRVVLEDDRDGDGRGDSEDPFPDDPRRCGDSDADGCDDCSTGTFDTTNDCAGGDGGAGSGGSDDGGCCAVAPGARRGGEAGVLALALLALALVRRRRRR